MNAPTLPMARTRLQLLQALLGLALAALVCEHLRLRERIVFDALPQAELRLLLAGLLATVALLGVRALRWNLILGRLGRRYDIAGLFRVYAGSFFLGLVTPGKLGEAWRVWLARERVDGLSTAAFSVVYDRAFDLAPTLLLVAALGAELGLREHPDLLLPARAILLLLALAIALLLLRPRALQARVASMLKRLHKVTAGARDAAPGLDRQTWLAALALSVLSQWLAVVQVGCFARAVGIDADPLQLYAVVSFATLVASLPISFAGFGTREASILWALGVLGTGLSQALAFASIWLLNFVFMLLLAATGFVLQRLAPESR